MSNSDRDRATGATAKNGAPSKASGAGKAAKKDSAPSSNPGKATTRRLSRRRRPAGEPATQKVTDQLNPVWWVPTMVSLMVVGLAWLVVAYLTETRYPIPSIGGWNLAVGFVMIMAGFLMTTRWR